MRVLSSTAAALVIAFAVPAHADFIDTEWRVVGFTGEAWFIEPQRLIGEAQRFHAGFSDGPFYSCDHGGQSTTYTKYSNNEFFANPEFSLFIPLKHGMTLSSNALFVHRITCEGSGSPNERRVMYPFVTNEARKSAWYLFEGGVFSFFAP
jgi:hypothetical protein